MVARRDVPGKEGKTMGIPLTGAAAHIDGLLRDIQKALFDQSGCALGESKGGRIGHRHRGHQQDHRNFPPSDGHHEAHCR